VKVSIIRRSSNCNKLLVKTCTNKHKLKLLSYIHKILNRQPIVTRHSLIYMVVIILFCIPYVYISCFLCTKNGRMKRVMAGRNRWWQQRYRLFFLSSHSSRDTDFILHICVDVLHRKLLFEFLLHH
jgi:hypothetical protein